MKIDALIVNVLCTATNPYSATPHLRSTVNWVMGFDSDGQDHGSGDCVGNVGEGNGDDGGDDGDGDDPITRVVSS